MGDMGKRRPYVVASAAVSVDGYLDDASPRRLLLSNEEDFDRVDGVRASVDAILVGAGTLRADDPRLLVRSETRRRERVEAGLAASPIRVVVTGTGDIDPSARVFTVGGAERIVYTTVAARPALAERLTEAATVVALGESIDLGAVLADLADRGVGRLLVEGGAMIHTRLLAAGLVDELRLAVAPFLIGDPAAPRFLGPAAYPYGPDNPLRLTEVDKIGDVAVLHYLAQR